MLLCFWTTGPWCCSNWYLVGKNLLYTGQNRRHEQDVSCNTLRGISSDQLLVCTRSISTILSKSSTLCFNKWFSSTVNYCKTLLICVKHQHFLWVQERILITNYLTPSTHTKVLLYACENVEKMIDIGLQR